MKNLIFNSVICLECGEQLISRHRHDYKSCSCENQVFNDGGLDYQRFGGKNLDLIQSHCIYDNSDFSTIRFYLERGSYGKNFDEPLHYIKLKDMTDEHLQNVIDYEEEHNPDNRFLKFYKKEQKYRKKL